MAASMIPVVLIPGADISPFIILGAVLIVFIIWFGVVKPEMDGKK